MTTLIRETIDMDKAIEHCLQNSMEELINGRVVCAEEQCQLAIWLLELKSMRNDMLILPLIDKYPQ